jgi:uncharacterized peroxidase-related enzyme
MTQGVDHPASGAAREPYIAVPEGLPGIVALLAFKQSTGHRVSDLMQEILRGPSPLTEGERELIGAYVSSLNDCSYCSQMHTAVAAHLLGRDRDAVCAVFDDVDAAPVSAKMRALLRIAAAVHRSGNDVAADDIAAAREAGATDEDIHDAVLVASAFCMINRYVDGLATIAPADEALYDQRGRILAQEGYADHRGRRIPFARRRRR